MHLDRHINAVNSIFRLLRQEIVKETQPQILLYLEGCGLPGSNLASQPINISLSVNLSSVIMLLFQYPINMKLNALPEPQPNLNQYC